MPWRIITGAGITGAEGGKLGKYSMSTRGKSFKWKPDTSVGAFKHKDRFRSPLEDAWDSFSPSFPWDWNDYGSMKEWSSRPLVGRIFEARASQLEYWENMQWLEDYAKNTGISLSDVKYPIRAGFYRGYTSPYATEIAATNSIISMYGNSKLLSWL